MNFNFKAPSRCERKCMCVCCHRKRIRKRDVLHTWHKTVPWARFITFNVRFEKVKLSFDWLIIVECRLKRMPEVENAMMTFLTATIIILVSTQKFLLVRSLACKVDWKRLFCFFCQLPKRKEAKKEEEDVLSACAHVLTRVLDRSVAKSADIGFSDVHFLFDFIGQTTSFAFASLFPHLEYLMFTNTRPAF